MTITESDKHAMGGGLLFNEMAIAGGDMGLDKGLQGTIVAEPNEVGVGSKDRIRARERAIKPGGEAICKSQEFEPATPFHPIAFAEIESKVRGPVGTVKVDKSEADARGSDAKGVG